MSGDAAAIISGTFHATAQLAAANNLPPDIILVTPDSVRFFVHASVLKRASSNDFAGLLGTPKAPNTVISIRDATCELDLILRVAYRMEKVDGDIPWVSLTRSVISLVTYYSVALPGPGNALFSALVAQVGRADGATDLYALAGQTGYEALAVYASGHLHSLVMANARPEWTVRVGSTYILRLYMLQMDRTKQFQRIVYGRPTLHAPQAGCDAENMEILLGSWELAAAELVIAARPDIKVAEIRAKFDPIIASCSCNACVVMLRDRMRTIVQAWSDVKGTI
ncbi:hypothetical protein AURDEDRAFT_113610 [Auricularia subglabra TFB-10046 SS5]|nr:hypothetical protein AURDEDRAFT_113610 [Auricularia subglabra TFB-10046 SS5]